MQIMLVIAPIPDADDGVALDTLGPGGFCMRAARPWRCDRSSRPNSCNARSRRVLGSSDASIVTPPCPDRMRANHASSEVADLPIGNGTFWGTVRVDLLPIWWQLSQPFDFILFNHSYCDPLLVGMPLP